MRAAPGTKDTFSIKYPLLSSLSHQLPLLVCSTLGRSTPILFAPLTTKATLSKIQVCELLKVGRPTVFIGSLPPVWINTPAGRLVTPAGRSLPSVCRA